MTAEQFDLLTPGEALRQVEDAVFKHALQKCGDDVLQAAAWLGCTRSTMYKRGYRSRNRVGAPPGIRPSTLEKRAKILKLIAEGLTVTLVAERLSITTASVYDTLRIKVID